MKKQRNWLFVKYKKEHPEAIPKEIKKQKRIPVAILNIGTGIVVFIILNVLALVLAALINPYIYQMFF